MLPQIKRTGYGKPQSQNAMRCTWQSQGSFKFPLYCEYTKPLHYNFDALRCKQAAVYRKILSQLTSVAQRITQTEQMVKRKNTNWLVVHS